MLHVGMNMEDKVNLCLEIEPSPAARLAVWHPTMS